MFKKIWTGIESKRGAALLALGSLVVGVYLSIFYEKQGEIVVKKGTLSRVFDIHHPVGGLEITYSGENLRTSNKVLWILTASIQNRGNASIRKTDFDDAVPIGFQIVGAEIAEQPQATSPVAYLLQNARLKHDRHAVTVAPAVFEPGDWIQISMLLLGPEGGRPALLPLGKIAGQKSIAVVEDDPASPPSRLDVLLAGDSWPKIIFRGLVYLVVGIISFVGLLISIAIAVSPFVYVRDRFEVHKRRKFVDAIPKSASAAPCERKLIDDYVRVGPQAFRTALRFVQLARARIDLEESLAHLPNARRRALIDRIGMENRQLFALFARKFEIDVTDSAAVAELETIVGNLRDALNLDQNDSLSTDEEFVPNLEKFMDHDKSASQEAEKAYIKNND